MSENAYKCDKCSSDMVRGLIAGRDDANYFQTIFVEGEPELAEFIWDSGQ